MQVQAVCYALCISSIVLPAYAEQQNECFEGDGMAESRNYLSSSLQWENDIGNSDRWYTNGMKYSRTKNLACNSDRLDSSIQTLFQNDKKTVLLSSWLGGMNMYTPQIITNPSPQPNDRPWTGWAYIGRSWESIEINKFENPERYKPGNSQKLEVQIGALGAWAHQGNVQRAWHSLIGAQAPQGWSNQKAGEVGVSVAYTGIMRTSWGNLDSNQRAGITVGNVVNQLSIGTGISYAINAFQHNDATFLPVASFNSSQAPQINPTLTAFTKFTTPQLSDAQKLANARSAWYGHSATYLFADVEGKLIGSSTFISGTNVVLKPFVVDTRFGLAHKCSDSEMTIRLTRLVRSPEFKYPLGGDAPWQKIWQLSLEWNWGWVRNPYITRSEPLSGQDSTY